MIEAYETGKAPAFELYALGLEHKHMPEIQVYSGLDRAADLHASVGNFRQGMLVSVPVHLDALPGKPKIADLIAAFKKHYRGQKHSMSGERGSSAHRAESLNGTNDIEIHVFRMRPEGRPCHREVRQPRQGGLGRGGAEPHADAGAVGLGVRRSPDRPLPLLSPRDCAAGTAISESVLSDSKGLRRHFRVV